MISIYKKDSTGKIRVITIEANGDQIVQGSGVFGSSKIVYHTKTAKPKNLGKSNETTAEQQAELEVASFIKDKLTKAYFLTSEEAEESVVIMPMLAKDYNKEKHKIKWGEEVVLAQPKLDGMRCLAFITKEGIVTLMSRGGKVINNMFHIEKDLSKIKRDLILDGELYVHGEGFETNMSYVKKYSEGNSERIQFNVYDTVLEDTYIERYSKVKSIVESLSSGNVVMVGYDFIYDEAELKEAHKKYIELGYEGSMVKLSRSGYKSNVRVSELLKYKDFIDIQLPILDIIPAENRPDWGQPVYFWEGASGHILGDNIIGSGTKMTHEQKMELLKNKEQFIGKIAEVRFFEYSDKGVPRFPVTVGIRLDK